MSSKTDITLSSTVFPTKEDVALWDSLSPKEQLALIKRDEEAGYQSGIAEPETLDERFKRVLAKLPVHAV